MSRDPQTEFEEDLDDRIESGGCAEAWAAANEIRAASSVRQRSRRAVLKKTLSTAVASIGVGLTGSTAASARTSTPPVAPESVEDHVAESLRGRYEDIESVHTAFGSVGGELLKELAKRDLIDSASVDSLNISRVTDRTMHLTDAASVGSTYNPVYETVTALLQTEITTEDGSIHISVQPEARAAGALYRRDERVDLLIRPASDNVVTLASNSSHCDCTDIKCEDCGPDDIGLKVPAYVICRDDEGNFIRQECGGFHNMCTANCSWDWPWW